MDHSVALFELATAYHSCRDLDALLKALSVQLGARLTARGVLVWLVDESGEALACRARWAEAGAGFAPSPEPVTQGILPRPPRAGRQAPPPPPPGPPERNPPPFFKDPAPPPLLPPPPPRRFTHLGE